MRMTTQGFFLINVDVAALNNAGADKSSNFDNAVAVKKIYKNKKVYAYVSGQAVRYWWRDVLSDLFNWQMSPILREKTIAFTNANPLIYPDDDMFGYMRAEKGGTFSRVSPLKNSALISIFPNDIVKNWSAMTRHQGDQVPYAKDEYSAIMKGMFSIDLSNVGVFTTENRSGFQNINEKLAAEIVQSGGKVINDEKALDKNGVSLKKYQISRKDRLDRIKQTISALGHLSGGAKQATNMADVAPVFIILTTLKGGNHLFSHVVTDENDEANLKIDSLTEILKDYKDFIHGKIFIGRRKGFFDQYDKSLSELADKNDCILYGSVMDAIKEYVNTLDSVITD